MAKQDYDSKFCGSLPINYINQIQNYGFLVITDLNLKIVQVSDNIGTFLGGIPAVYVDTPLKALIDAASDKDLDEKMASRDLKRFTVNMTVSGTNSSFLALVHVKADHILFEFEPLNADDRKSF